MHERASRPGLIEDVGNFLVGGELATPACLKLGLEHKALLIGEHVKAVLDDFSQGYRREFLTLRRQQADLGKQAFSTAMIGDRASTKKINIISVL